ncbi:MAG: hypothetical protein AVDCRST_MAG53-1418, partial [uncultured Solirubrobacteraceae bacterium]
GRQGVQEGRPRRVELPWQQRRGGGGEEAHRGRVQQGGRAQGQGLRGGPAVPRQERQDGCRGRAQAGGAEEVV